MFWWTWKPPYILQRQPKSEELVLAARVVTYSLLAAAAPLQIHKLLWRLLEYIRLPGMNTNWYKHKVTSEEVTLMGRRRARKVAQSRRLCQTKRFKLQSSHNYKSKCFSIEAILSSPRCHFLCIILLPLQFKSPPDMTLNT